MIIAFSFLSLLNSNYKDAITLFNKLDKDGWIHFDVMDGLFVENKTFDCHLIKEINNYNKDWRIDRDITYACKVLTNSVKKDEDYSNMKKVIQININRLGKTNVGCQIYNLRSEESKEGFKDVLTDIIQIYVVNIDFYKNLVYNGNKKLIKDNYLLCAMDLEPDDIDKISERNEDLMRFKKMLEEINDREDFVNWISAEEESKKIERTKIIEAKKDGLQQGIEQGIQEEKIEIAKNMLLKNMDIHIISEVTGLSIEQITSLE